MSPRQIYKVEGKRVPGVTTILKNVGWSSTPLMYWGASQGFSAGAEAALGLINEMQGPELVKAVRRLVDEPEGGYAILQDRKEAADIGTVGHYLIERELHGAPISLEEAIEEFSGKLDITVEIWERATQCLESFQQWAKNMDLKTKETELSLTSQRGYGGTIDWIGEIGGELSLMDFKTGGIYPDHLCQLAAYGQLYCENSKLTGIPGGYHLLRIGKEDASFTHHHKESLPTAWDAFECALELHGIHKQLRKMT